MKPLNAVAAVAAIASCVSLVKNHVAPNVGGSKSTVIKSCVFPDGMMYMWRTKS